MQEAAALLKQLTKTMLGTDPTAIDASMIQAARESGSGSGIGGGGGRYGGGGSFHRHSCGTSEGRLLPGPHSGPNATSALLLGSGFERTSAGFERTSLLGFTARSSAANANNRLPHTSSRSSLVSEALALVSPPAAAASIGGSGSATAGGGATGGSTSGSPHPAAEAIGRSLMTRGLAGNSSNGSAASQQPQLHRGAAAADPRIPSGLNLMELLHAALGSNSSRLGGDGSGGGGGGGDGPPRAGGSSARASLEVQSGRGRQPWAGGPAASSSSRGLSRTERWQETLLTSASVSRQGGSRAGGPVSGERSGGGSRSRSAAQVFVAEGEDHRSGPQSGSAVGLRDEGKEEDIDEEDEEDEALLQHGFGGRLLRLAPPPIVPAAVVGGAFQVAAGGGDSVDRGEFARRRGLSMDLMTTIASRLSRIAESSGTLALGGASGTFSSGMLAGRISVEGSEGWSMPGGGSGLFPSQGSSGPVPVTATLTRLSRGASGSLIRTAPHVDVNSHGSGGGSPPTEGSATVTRNASGLSVARSGDSGNLRPMSRSRGTSRVTSGLIRVTLGSERSRSGSVDSALGATAVAVAAVGGPDDRPVKIVTDAGGSDGPVARRSSLIPDVTAMAAGGSSSRDASATSAGAAVAEGGGVALMAARAQAAHLMTLLAGYQQRSGGPGPAADTPSTCSAADSDRGSMALSRTSASALLPSRIGGGNLCPSRSSSHRDDASRRLSFFLSGLQLEQPEGSGDGSHRGSPHRRASMATIAVTNDGISPDALPCRRASVATITGAHDGLSPAEVPRRRASVAASFGTSDGLSFPAAAAAAATDFVPDGGSAGARTAVRKLRMPARRAASFMLPPGYGRQWEGPLPSVSQASGAATPAAAGAGVRAAAWALLGPAALGRQPLPSSLQPANVPERSLHPNMSPDIKVAVPAVPSSRRLSVDARLPSSPSQLAGFGGGGGGEVRGQNVKRRPPFRRGSLPDMQAAVSISIAEESE